MSNHYIDTKHRQNGEKRTSTLSSADLSFHKLNMPKTAEQTALLLKAENQFAKIQELKNSYTG